MRELLLTAAEIHRDDQLKSTTLLKSGRFQEMEPTGFLCPITQDVMEDPVVTADGNSYERAAIEHWLRTHNTSPLTNLALPSTSLLPNISLRHSIEEWRGQQPMGIDPDCLMLSDEVLGTGSWGVVRGGTLTLHGRAQRVAVKMLPGLAQEEQRRQFDKELKAHILAQQGADGVCRLIGTCEKEHQLCVVMRRYERSLKEKIDAGEFEGNQGEVRRVAHSLCRTLAQLHAAGVVLQDIKPQNVLLDQYDLPVLADFGIANVITRTTKVMPTSVQGTFNYMAPEAFEPPLGVEADVWSIGCVIVEMVTGQPPWSELQMQQIMMAVAMRKRAPEVPDAVPSAQAVRRCFAFEPGERPTAAELAEEMQQAQSSQAGSGAEGDANDLADEKARNARLSAELDQLKAEMDRMITEMQEVSVNSQCTLKRKL